MLNAVSFGGRNNDNNPTGGKWIGTGLGAAWGGYLIYKFNKTADEIDKFMTPEASKKVAECKDFDALTKIIKESNLSENLKKRFFKLFEFSKKHNKDELKKVQGYVEGLQKPRTGKPILVAAVLFSTLLGLGLGAIVDHFRKNDRED